MSSQSHFIVARLQTENVLVIDALAGDSSPGWMDGVEFDESCELVFREIAGVIVQVDFPNRQGIDG